MVEVDRAAHQANQEVLVLAYRQFFLVYLVSGPGPDLTSTSQRKKAMWNNSANFPSLVVMFDCFKFSSVKDIILICSRLFPMDFVDFKKRHKSRMLYYNQNMSAPFNSHFVNRTTLDLGTFLYFM